MEITKADVGRKVQRRDGRIVKIEEWDGSNQPILAGGLWYVKSGRINFNATGCEEHRADLVSFADKKRGGARPGAGRPKGSTKAAMAARRVALRPQRSGKTEIVKQAAHAAIERGDSVYYVTGKPLPRSEQDIGVALIKAGHLEAGAALLRGEV